MIALRQAHAEVMRCLVAGKEIIVGVSGLNLAVATSSEVDGRSAADLVSDAEPGLDGVGTGMRQSAALFGDAENLRGESERHLPVHIGLPFQLCIRHKHEAGADAVPTVKPFPVFAVHTGVCKVEIAATIAEIESVARNLRAIAHRQPRRELGIDENMRSLCAGEETVILVGHQRIKRVAVSRESVANEGIRCASENQFVERLNGLTAAGYRNVEVALFTERACVNATHDAHIRFEILVAVVVAVQFAAAFFLIADKDIDVACATESEKREVAFFEGKIELERSVLIAGNGIGTELEIEQVENGQGRIAVADEIRSLALFTEGAFGEHIPSEKTELRAVFALAGIAIAHLQVESSGCGIVVFGGEGPCEEVAVGEHFVVNDGKRTARCPGNGEMVRVGNINAFHAPEHTGRTVAADHDIVPRIVGALYTCEIAGHARRVSPAAGEAIGFIHRKQAAAHEGVFIVEGGLPPANSNRRCTQCLYFRFQFDVEHHFLARDHHNVLEQQFLVFTALNQQVVTPEWNAVDAEFARRIGYCLQAGVGALGRQFYHATGEWLTRFFVDDGAADGLGLGCQLPGCQQSEAADCQSLQAGSGPKKREGFHVCWCRVLIRIKTKLCIYLTKAPVWGILTNIDLWIRLQPIWPMYRLFARKFMRKHCNGMPADSSSAIYRRKRSISLKGSRSQK